MQVVAFCPLACGTIARSFLTIYERVVSFRVASAQLIMNSSHSSFAEFYIEGYSAGSYTGAVLFLALRRLFPACRLAAKLGAVAMPKGVFSLLQTKTLPGRCRVHLVHAEEDLLCDWQPSQFERHVIAHRLDYTVVCGSDKWMGASKHQYLHWLRCQLPLRRHELATLKLRHPEVIPVRDRMAAPLRLASWVRFETVMDRHQWSTAIALLVPSIHLPDEALLVLLNQCAPDQGITSMEEAQALLLRNFRVGGAQESECTKWLTCLVPTTAPICRRSPSSHALVDQSCCSSSE